MLVKPNDSMLESRAPFSRVVTAIAPSAREVAQAEHRFAEWNAMIEMLRGWQANPRRAIDEDYDAPSQAAIGLALDLARASRDAGGPSATRMSPTGDGGIAFEWRRPQGLVEIEIETDGAAELRVFVGTRLVRRLPLSSLSS